MVIKYWAEAPGDHTKIIHNSTAHTHMGKLDTTQGFPQGYCTNGGLG